MNKVGKKRKALYFLVVLCLMLALVVAAGCGETNTPAAPAASGDGDGDAAAVAAPAETYTLIFQSSWPRTPVFTYVHEDMAAKAMAASGGQLVIETYAAGEVVPADEQLTAMQTGVLDIANGAGSYYAGFTIGNIENGLPFAWMSADECTVIYRQMGLQDIIAAEYDAAQCHYFGPSFEDHYCVISTKPVNSLDDLRAMKVRLMGGFASVGNAVGINSVMIPYDEVYLGLTTGVCDAGLFGGLYAYVDAEYQDICDYYCTTPWVSPLVGNYVMGKAKYDSLPAHLQALLDLTYCDAGLMYTRQYNMYGEYNYSDLFTCSELPAEDIAILTEAAMQIWDEEAAKSDACAQAIDLVKDLAKGTGRL